MLSTKLGTIKKATLTYTFCGISFHEIVLYFRIFHGKYTAHKEPEKTVCYLFILTAKALTRMGEEW
jgi:hypothetical protein